VRAARLLQSETGCMLGVDIAVEKHIPLGGGLAAQLGRGNHADRVEPSVVAGFVTRAPDALGLQLGADVPVFVFGENAFARAWAKRCRPALAEAGMWCCFPRRRYRPQRFSRTRN